jgi:pantoate--beta-alanine ligase
VTQVLRTPQELRAWRKSIGSQTVGVIPTMGALHAGHEALLQRSAKENQFTILTIFVNPTQFNKASDLKNYPKTWDQDLQMAEKNNVSIIFYPEPGEMYPDDYKYKVIETEYSQNLCGKDRPGHFDGVLTVVTKLLNLAQADRAYFGEKDFQQLSLVKGLVQALFIPTEIINVPTVREADGLAMSSRNLRLTATEREKAPMIYKVIKTAKTTDEAQRELENLGFKVDYITDDGNRRFVAVNVGEVRLIDNIEI